MYLGEAMTIRFMKYIYYRMPIIVKLLVVILILMLLFGTLIHLVEPTQFPTVFDGVWWAFVTGATVGYGDYVPLTPSGRIIAILLILTGGGLIAFYISSIATTTLNREKDLEGGKLPFRGTNHFIFIGWNERTKQLIPIVTEKYPSKRIVLIDRSLRQIKYDQYPVHFIHGDATEDTTLINANIAEAHSVLITSDITKNERQADNHTIITTIAIRGNNREIPIIAEILSTVQIENALRAGATTIIRSNDFMSGLFFHELSHTKTATPFEDIIQILIQQQFTHKKLPPELENHTFESVLLSLLKDGYLIVGYIRDDETYINPKSDQLLIEEDILISLKKW